MPAKKTTRADALALIAAAFRAHGYDGTSLSLIAQATGLGRASLYHHFPGGKEEMAREVFAHTGAAVDALLLAPLRGPGTPAERIDAHCAGIRAFYEGGAANCLLGALTLSGGADLFQAELAASFKLWIDALAKVLREAGQGRGPARRAAERAVAQVQGALILSRGLGQLAAFQRSLAALPQLLLGDAQA